MQGTIGFSIKFPPGTVESTVSVSVCCSFNNEFSPPNGREFVSPVYILHVQPKTRFLKNVTLSLRHWAKSNGSDLSFGFCRFPNNNLPYGAFTSLTSGNSGTIEVAHFSGGVITRAIRWISRRFSGKGILSTVSFNNYIYVSLLSLCLYFNSYFRSKPLRSIISISIINTIE